MDDTDHPQTFSILPAECVGVATQNDDGTLDIGGLSVQLGKVWWNDNQIAVYVRRLNHDLTVIEIHMAHHDGLAQEELDTQNEEAQRYPLGPKEYWRSQQVGKWTYGADGHLMTNEEFEADWDESDDDE